MSGSSGSRRVRRQLGVYGLIALSALGLNVSAQVASLESVIYGTDTALGLQGNNTSSLPGCCQRQQSADGRYVVFVTAADNLISNDTNIRNDVYLRDTTTGETRRVSVATGGGQGNGVSDSPSISSDGRYIAFRSDANNLVANDFNAQSDVFVHDRVAATTVRVSVSDAGIEGSAGSLNPSISADGRYIAFTSGAGNLVPSDTFGLNDIFRFDRNTATVLRINVSSAGAQADAQSDFAAISDDGSVIAFQSRATVLVAGDNNNANDIFVRDITAGTTSRISVDSSGAQASGPSERPTISGDGLTVAFESTAGNLVAGDNNSRNDIFVRNRSSGTTTRVSVSSAGVQSNEASSRPSLSGDGRYVLFQSDASNLIAADSNTVTDVFLHDRNDASTVRVSVETGGAQANGASVNPSLSADGNLVLFETIATNLMGAADTNNVADVYRRNRTGASTVRISLPDVGGPFAVAGNGSSSLSGDKPQISADGRFVVFQTSATNLFVGDSNGTTQDVLLFDRNSATLELISVSTAGVQGNNQSVNPSTSADGRFVAFESTATNLAAGDADGITDIFVRDRTLTTTTLVSQSTGGTKGNSTSDSVSISSDGRYVAFRSQANNLVAGDTGGNSDIFVHDRNTAITTRVSIDSLGVQGNNFSYAPAISGDGRHVAFTSYASNLITGDTNGVQDIFAHDRVTAVTTRASVDSGALQSNAGSERPSISSDGSRVVFDSTATNLVPGDTNGQRDVFLRDTTTGTTSRVNISSTGAQGISEAEGGAISADGNTVVFSSYASNLTPFGGNFQYQIFARDLTRTVTTMVSIDTERTIGNSQSFRPSISADGAWVAFDSSASNWILQRGENGSSQDVFLAQRHVQEQSSTSIFTDLPDPSVVGQPITVVVKVTGATFAPTDGRALVQSSSGENCTDSDGPVPAGADAQFSCQLTINSASAWDLTATFSRSSTHIDSVSPVEFHSVQALPTLVISDVSQAEGTGATSSFSFTITRSHNLNPVSVRVDTANSSAIAGTDYTAVSNQIVNFTQGGALTANVVVDVAGDAVVETDEAFFVQLSAAVGATISDSSGTSTISNDDTATLSIDDVSQNEGTGSSTASAFTVTLNGEVAYSFNVSFASGDGTAIAGQDYQNVNSSVNFTGANGQSRTINMTVFGDAQVEANETFFVNLIAPGGGITLGDGQGQGTIVNDDAIAVSPTSLGNAQVGVGYSAGIGASNGINPYSFMLSAGALPAGLSLSASGSLNGTPTEAGTFNFDVQATDSTPAGNGGPFSNTRSYTLLVNPPSISLSPGVLSNGLPPQPYSTTLTAFGGTAPYAFALVPASGSLPPGITLEADGDLVGTPTTPGSYTFSVAATDSSTGTGSPFTGTQSYSLIIDNNAPTMSTPTTQTMLEDSAPLQVAVTVGDEETADAALNVSATSANPDIVPNPVVGAGATDDQRLITIDSAPNANGGPLTITLMATDADSGNQFAQFNVTVTAVNDAPSLTLGANLNEVAGVSGFRSVPNFVQGYSLGPVDEAQSQTLLGYSLAPVSDPIGIVSSANLALNGTLTYSLTGRGGTARFAVVAIDNGGAANGGDPYSAPVEFDITVAAGADLQISKSDLATIVQPDQPLLYDIFVANAGPSPVLGARVQDTPPGTLSGATWSCTPVLLASCGNAAGVGAIDELVNLPPGSVLRYSMAATVNAEPGTTINNTATVTSSASVAELDANNNSDTDTNALLLDGVFLDGFESGTNRITVPFER